MCAYEISTVYYVLACILYASKCTLCTRVKSMYMCSKNIYMYTITCVYINITRIIKYKTSIDYQVENEYKKVVGKHLEKFSTSCGGPVTKKTLLKYKLSDNRNLHPRIIQERIIIIDRPTNMIPSNTSNLL